MKKYWRTRTYHRRSLIESAISRLKRLYGGFLYSRGAYQQRKEVLLRMIADNLNFLRQQNSPLKTKTFNKAPAYDELINLITKKSQKNRLITNTQ